MAVNRTKDPVRGVFYPASILKTVSSLLALQQREHSEVIQKIADAIALGLADDEAASLAGISDLTLTTWRKDPEFLRKIKNAVSTRLAMRAIKD